MSVIVNTSELLLSRCDCSRDKLDKLTIEFVKGSLLDSDIKRKTTNDDEENFGAQSIAFSAINKKKKTDVTSVAKEGHYQNECYENVHRNSRNHCNHPSNNQYHNTTIPINDDLFLIK